MFVSKFFMPDGRYVQHIWSSKEGGKTKEFTINAHSLGRFYWTHFDSGVQNLQMKVEGAKEIPMANGGALVACERAQITHWFANGTQVSADRREHPRRD